MLLAFCEEKPSVTRGFSSQRLVTRNFDFFFICAWTNSWANNRDSVYLRRHLAHYDVIVIKWEFITVMSGIAIFNIHYSDVIIGTKASQITSLAIVYSTIYSDADQRKHQNSASLAFVRGIHRGPVNSPHKWPVPRKMFPFDDVIMFPVE